jgi:hypothetical protein
MSAGVACGYRPFSRKVPRKRFTINDKGRDKGGVASAPQYEGT